jgi:hypothetical protein
MCCCIYGAVTGWLGTSAGVNAASFANLSAPWLLIALLPALRARSLARGALVGFSMTMSALGCFYVMKTLLLSGHNGGGGFLSEFNVELVANRVYFIAGAFTGPVFGAAGALLGRSRRVNTGWLVAGALLATEIAVLAATNGRQLLPSPLYFSWAVDHWTAYWAEAAVGVSVLLAGLTRRRDGRRS